MEEEVRYEGKEGQEMMLFDWPFGTFCAVLIYFLLIYLFYVLIRGFSRKLCLYEFEVLGLE